MTRILTKVRVIVTNRASNNRVITVEPWASEYTLEPGSEFEIHAEGDLSFPLTLELTLEGLTFGTFDSEGGLVRVFREGKPAKPDPP